MSHSTIRIGTLLALLFLIAAIGCGSSNHSMSGTTNPTPTPGVPNGGGGGGGGSGSGGGGSAPSQALFLYGSSGQGVRGGKIDSSTGQVISVPMRTNPTTGVTGFETGSGGFVKAIAIDRLGRFLFTADIQTFSFGNAIGQNAIGAFTIDRTSGVLNRISGSPYMLTARPQDIAIDGGGRFVYVSLPGTIDVWSVNQSSGALTHVTSTSGGGAELAATWDGRFLLSNAGGTVTSYSIDQSNGQLTPVSTAAVGNSDGLSLSIGNQNAYSWTGNTATVLSLDSGGKLTVGRSGVVLQGGTRAFYISVAADNRAAYVTMHDDSSGAGHFVHYDGIGGDQLGIFGTFVMHAEVDFNGKFIYATSPMQTYTFNSNGALVAGPTAQGPVADVQFFRLSP